MSIVERSPSAQAPAGRLPPRSDRLRVITAGHVGNMEARLGASGFDVVAIAESEGALIDAVSADEPDAIVVEADLCDSLEHVRDLAPDAVLIVVGDHTPVGALGRIERGVSGTVMAGLLHALVAEGVGAAAAWGVVPAFGPGTGLHVSQRVGGWLLSAKADLLRAPVVNALRDHAELVTAAVTVAVTVSASLALTQDSPRTHDRPVRVPTPAVVPAPPNPVAATFSTTPTPAHVPTTTAPAYRPPRNKREPVNKPGSNPGKSRHHVRYDHPSSGDATRPPGVANGWDHRPPKHDDNGHHTGWNRNSVPEDLPPGNSSAHGGNPANSSAHGGNVGNSSAHGGGAGSSSAHGGSAGSSSAHGGNGGSNSAHGNQPPGT